MAVKTNKESYRDLKGKRIAQAHSRRPFNGMLTHAVALGGTDLEGLINNHRADGIIKTLLVEQDKTSFRILKKQSDGHSGVKVRHGDIREHLPRVSRKLVVELDFEDSLADSRNQSLVHFVNKRGYNLTVTFCLRNYSGQKNIQSFVDAIGERWWGVLKFKSKIPYINQFGGKETVKVFTFQSDKRIYQFLIYKSSKYNAPMGMITAVAV